MNDEVLLDAVARIVADHIYCDHRDGLCDLSVKCYTPDTLRLRAIETASDPDIVREIFFDHYDALLVIISDHICSLCV